MTSDTPSAEIISRQFSEGIHFYAYVNIHISKEKLDCPLKLFSILICWFCFVVCAELTSPFGILWVNSILHLTLEFLCNTSEALKSSFIQFIWEIIISLFKFMIMATMQSIINTLYLLVVLHFINRGFEQLKDMSKEHENMNVHSYDIYGMKGLPGLLEDWNFPFVRNVEVEPFLT